MKFLHKRQLFFYFKRTDRAPKWEALLLIMLVTMATPISSHVKDKDGIFTARDERKIVEFHQYLYNK